MYKIIIFLMTFMNISLFSQVYSNSIFLTGGYSPNIYAEVKLKNGDTIVGEFEIPLLKDYIEYRNPDKSKKHKRYQADEVELIYWQNHKLAFIPMQKNKKRICMVTYFGDNIILGKTHHLISSSNNFSRPTVSTTYYVYKIGTEKAVKANKKNKGKLIEYLSDCEMVSKYIKDMYKIYKSKYFRETDLKLTVLQYESCF